MISLVGTGYQKSFEQTMKRNLKENSTNCCTCMELLGGPLPLPIPRQTVKRKEWYNQLNRVLRNSLTELLKVHGANFSQKCYFTYVLLSQKLPGWVHFKYYTASSQIYPIHYQQRLSSALSRITKKYWLMILILYWLSSKPYMSKQKIC